MKLQEPLANLLGQLHQVLDELNLVQYAEPVGILSDSSIGQHTRHILEFFIELQKGYECGVVDYDQRQRNHKIESDNGFARAQLEFILKNLERPDKVLILRADYGSSGEMLPAEVEGKEIMTNYFRELVYNLEHTVHHMALIRIGVGLVSSISLPVEFGVASSTLKFRAACVQ
jgi:hypothetical protein